MYSRAPKLSLKTVRYNIKFKVLLPIESNVIMVTIPICDIFEINRQ